MRNSCASVQQFKTKVLFCDVDIYPVGAEFTATYMLSTNLEQSRIQQADARPDGRCDMRSSRIIKDYTLALFDEYVNIYSRSFPNVRVLVIRVPCCLLMICTGAAFSANTTNYLIYFGNFFQISLPWQQGSVNDEPQNHTLGPKITTLSYTQPELCQFKEFFKNFPTDNIVLNI